MVSLWATVRRPRCSDTIKRCLSGKQTIPAWFWIFRDGPWSRHVQPSHQRRASTRYKLIATRCLEAD